jgi:cystathionine beta-lyase
MGMNVAPDDCAVVMRGLGTMSLRLQRHQSSALEIAMWLEQQPAVERVLYPALASDPGHRLWKRDFSGSSGLLSVLLRPGALADSCRFVDALNLFRIGASWGGIQSLVALYPLTESQRSAIHCEARSLVRLHVGLESPVDLRNDLARALDAIE